MQEPVGPPAPTAAQMASNPLRVQVDKELQEMNLGTRFTFSNSLVKDEAKTMQDERDKKSAEQNQIDLLAQAAHLKQFNSSDIENARAEALALKRMRN
jgi:anti-sigma28 factor (negative regulator of flagellin synthesis)